MSPAKRNAAKNASAASQDTGKNTALKSSTVLPKARGLSNLGNTCFFNAVMQCLSQTHPFVQMLDTFSLKGATFNLAAVELPPVKNEDHNDEDGGEEEASSLPSMSLPLIEAGPTTLALAAFFKEMHSVGKAGVVNPGHLFGQICKNSSQFRGFQQQDAHELLRHLIDRLRTEEIRRQKTAILRHFGLNEKTDPKKVDPATKIKLQQLGKQSNHTLVDKLFGGYFISTIVCEQCHYSSQVYEPFLDLSLPIVNQRPTRPAGSSGKKDKRDDLTVSCFRGQNSETDEAEVKKSKAQLKKEKMQAKKDRRRNKGKKSGVAYLSAENHLPDDGDGPDESVPNDVNHEVPSSANHLPPESDEDAAPRAETQSGARDEDDGNGGSKSLAPEDAGKKEQSVDDDDNTNVEDEEDDDEGLRTGQSRVSETGASSNADVEDNVEDGQLGFYANPQHLDPHMEALCRQVRKVSLTASSVMHDDLQEAEPEKVQRLNNKQQNEWIARCLTSMAPRYQASSKECSLYASLSQFTSPELLTGNNKWACDRCTEIQNENAQNHDGESCKKKATVYSYASKQLFIFCPPAVLTIHLKRFQQTAYNLGKDSRFVQFPQTLDLAPFCSTTSLANSVIKAGAKAVLYGLYAVIEHSGRLQGGHYTVFVKVRACANLDWSQFLTSPIGCTDIAYLLHLILQKNQLSVGSDEPLQVQDPGHRGFHISDSCVTEVTEDKVMRCQAYLLFYERVC